jgi:iron complex transport system permease protein
MTSRRTDAIVLASLILLTLFTVLVSIRWGAITFSLQDIRGALWTQLSGGQGLSLDQRVFIELRLPRAILCVFVGASLGVGGTLMQGLFRNPIVEPGLVGTSAGAAFGAALSYVFGKSLGLDLGGWALPAFACTGAVISTALVFGLAHRQEQARTSVLRLLLTGLAINALFASGIGFLSYIARDPQARSIIYWNLGTVSGADWNSVCIVGATTMIGMIAALRCAKSLNALLLGEEEAASLGVNVNRLKWSVLTINVLIVAVATAFTGVISFVGLIVPHVLRTLRGSDNRFLILGSGLLGGSLLSVTDVVARVLVRPAELPIGIVTALVGVPVFISLLRARESLF